MNDKIISMFCISIVGPLLIYIGNNKNNTPDIYYNIIGLIGLMIPYFMATHKVYEAHWLVLLFLFLFVAISKKALPLFLYDILILVGCFIIVFHAYYLFQPIYPFSNWIK